MVFTDDCHFDGVVGRLEGGRIGRHFALVAAARCQRQLRQRHVETIRRFLLHQHPFSSIHFLLPVIQLLFFIVYVVVRSQIGFSNRISHDFWRIPPVWRIVWLPKPTY